MKVRVFNRSRGAVHLYYDRRASGGGLALAPGASVTVAVPRDDSDIDPVEFSVHDNHLFLDERGVVTERSDQAPAEAVPPYDANGRLADAAHWQIQFLLALHDLVSDADEIGFAPELIDDLMRLRLRFVDEFEARFPGTEGGRALWRPRRSS